MGRLSWSGLSENLKIRVVVGMQIKWIKMLEIDGDAHF